MKTRMEMNLQKMVKVILKNIFKTKKFMLTELSPELQTAQLSRPDTLHSSYTSLED